MTSCGLDTEADSLHSYREKLCLVQLCCGDLLAVIDPLTRLYNRRMGLAALEREVARTERTRRPLTVLMCDLDHFKHLNDTYGHLQGDVALRATADVLRQTLRRSDVICRFGGEEFLVVLAETAPDDATVLAARLFVAIEAAGQALGLPMTISIGLTSHRPGDRAEDLLHRADGALYASKDHGRNRFSADIDGSGVVDASDLSFILANWGGGGAQ